MGLSSFERMTAFENNFARAQATEVVEFPWGFAVLQSDFPLSQYHNRIVVSSSVSPVEVLAAAKEVLGGASIRHGYVSTENDELGQALQSDLEAAGFEHEVVASMIYEGPKIERASHQVKAVTFETMRPAIIRDWRVELPQASDEELGQLADRTQLYACGAELTRLAVLDGEEVAAHANLYIGRAERIAQFENLTTHADYRGRGYGSALVSDALWRGQETGCDLLFLTAGLDEWPYAWYQRLGYLDAGRTHHFTGMSTPGPQALGT